MKKRIAALAAGVVTTALVLTGCYSQQQLPQNKLNCTTLHAGYIAVFDPTSRTPESPAAQLNIKTGQYCTWEWPSFQYGDNIQHFQNPPITVVNSAGVLVDFPGNDEFITAPLGSHWDAKTQEVVTP